MGDGATMSMLGAYSLLFAAPAQVWKWQILLQNSLMACANGDSLF
jgi:hypothetical protein